MAGKLRKVGPFTVGDVVQIHGFDGVFRLISFISTKKAVVKDVIGFEDPFNIEVSKLFL